ncbi:uncharacterized protein LOC113857855 [Abrus precatorius]|uniref:Uncharacterized protein LOC113857855 n=1 Tax=Abrus precatorius TaxID=3816 RepID=A0A8B8KRF7_ABRPR|nr:uncharacterized protein LOC113857855 [Abrus precatorius]
MANQEASINNLENQMGQILKKINEPTQGSFFGNTVENPKEFCQAIITRSGKVIEPQPKKKPLEKEDDLLYPHIPKNKGKEEQFSKFLDIFRKLHINIPFAEALEQIPLYAKFMTELLSKKRKLKKDVMIALTEECSAILQQKLPPKLTYPGSFTIPCIIGNVTIGKALCDLGASTNLMPLSILKKLGVGEVKSTRMALQLADRSIKYLYGVMEDVLVKVDKMIFLANFVILDMDEDSEVPMILGRPFLATRRALIDVQQGKLMLRMHDEKAPHLKHSLAHSDARPCISTTVLLSLSWACLYKHGRASIVAGACLSVSTGVHVESA